MGPRQSLTAANADQWVGVPPGTEYLVALGMIRVILEEDMCDHLSAQRQTLFGAAQRFSLETITAQTGCSRQTLYALENFREREDLWPWQAVLGRIQQQQQLPQTFSAPLFPALAK